MPTGKAHAAFRHSLHGIDHIAVHYTNEIAQSGCCYGRPVCQFLAGEFLELDKAKMSKSSGSFLHLGRIMEDSFSPLDYRYLLLTMHYRSRQ